MLITDNEQDRSASKMIIMGSTNSYDRNHINTYSDLSGTDLYSETYTSKNVEENFKRSDMKKTTNSSYSRDVINTSTSIVKKKVGPRKVSVAKNKEYTPEFYTEQSEDNDRYIPSNANNHYILDYTSDNSLKDYIYTSQNADVKAGIRKGSVNNNNTVDYCSQYGSDSEYNRGADPKY